MDYREIFEDDGFVYELKVLPSNDIMARLHTFAKGDGFLGEWTIIQKQDHVARHVCVTDDNCDVIVYNSVAEAVAGSKEFLSLR